MKIVKPSSDSGYTLIELLLTMAILGIVGAGIVMVYRVFDETYTRATSLEAAQLGARAGLDRMTNELRLIGAYYARVAGAGNAIVGATPTSITFMSDVDGDTVINGAETTVAAGTTATGGTVTVSGSATQAASAFNVYAPPNNTLNDYVHIANGATREVRQIQSREGTNLTLTTPLAAVYPGGAIVRSVERVTYTFNVAANTLTRSVGGGGSDTIVGDDTLRVTGLTLIYLDAAGINLGAAPPLTQIREIQISLITQGADGSRRTMTSRVRPRSL